MFDPRYMDDEACVLLSPGAGAGVRIWSNEVDFCFHRHQPDHRNGANMRR